MVFACFQEGRCRGPAGGFSFADIRPTVEVSGLQHTAKPTYFSHITLEAIQLIIAFCLPGSQVLILLPIIPSLCALDILPLI